jgi:hypothetical protein
MSNVKTSADQCGNACDRTSGCTHFSWTDYNSGTCWLKSYPSISKADAIQSNVPSIICGFANLKVNNKKSIELWKSEPNNGLFLSRLSDLTFTQSTSGGTNYNINVNDGVKYQQMDGFGPGQNVTGKSTCKNGSLLRRNTGQN